MDVSPNTFPPSAPPASESIPDHILHTTVKTTGGDYVKLYTSIGTNWRALGHALGLQQHILDSIDEEHRSVGRKAKAVLSTSHNRLGRSFTYGLLVPQLEALGLTAAIECIVNSASNFPNPAPTPVPFFQASVMHPIVRSATVPRDLEGVPVPIVGNVRAGLRKRIGTHWRHVGTLLGVPPYELDAIDHNQRDGENKAEVMLNLCASGLEDQFTVGYLLNTLRNADMNDVADWLIAAMRTNK